MVCRSSLKHNCVPMPSLLSRTLIGHICFSVWCDDGCMPSAFPLCSLGVACVNTSQTYVHVGMCLGAVLLESHIHQGYIPSITCILSELDVHSVSHMSLRAEYTASHMCWDQICPASHVYVRIGHNQYHVMSVLNTLSITSVQVRHTQGHTFVRVRHTQLHMCQGWTHTHHHTCVQTRHTHCHVCRDQTHPVSLMCQGRTHTASHVSGLGMYPVLYVCLC